MTVEAIHEALVGGGATSLLSIIFYIMITALLSRVSRARPTHLDMAERYVGLYKSMNEIGGEGDLHEETVLARLRAMAFREGERAGEPQPHSRRGGIPGVAETFTGTIVTLIEILFLALIGAIDLGEPLVLLFSLIALLLSIVFDLTLWDALKRRL